MKDKGKVQYKKDVPNSKNLQAGSQTNFRGNTASKVAMDKGQELEVGQ